MLRIFGPILVLCTAVLAQQSAYGQCGGIGYSGPTTCGPGYACKFSGDYYSQCVPVPPAADELNPYDQCGGMGYTGKTKCSAGYYCSYSNAYYSQCIPGTAPASTTASTFSTSSTPKTTTTTPKATSTTTTAPTSTKPTTTATGTSTTPTSTKSTTSTTITSPTTTPTAPASSTSNSGTATVATYNCAVSNAPPASAGKVKYAGINIAGFDFGCTTDGSCNIGNVQPPLGPSYNGHDGPGQMQHFAAEGFNIFRLPVGWQYLTNNGGTATGTLDAGNLAQYDLLVQACLNTGAVCLIDLHNYARFNGQVVGHSGGPSNAVFASLWANLAAKYKNSKVAFGIVNEPHDMPDTSEWVATVQAVVTAIRNAGAVTQMILLPGTQYTSALYFVSSGYADALLAVSNPDGSKTGLIFEVHKYLDSDGSGSGGDCVSTYIPDAFSPLAQYLRCHGRQALLAEIGGINSGNCLNYVCQVTAYLNANSDVYLGHIGWAAGSFDSSYALWEGPNGATDQPLVAQCMKP